MVLAYDRVANQIQYDLSSVSMPRAGFTTRYYSIIITDTINFTSTRQAAMWERAIK